MTKEQIKQKAEAEADKVVIGSGMDRASVIHLKHLLVTMYMQGATEATKELEKENAELKCECRRCVYTDSPCILSDYGKDKNGICDHFKDVFEENAELKHTTAELRRDKDNLNTHTKAQEKLSEYRSDQLTKAKEIIKDLLSLCEGETDSKLVFTRAEQFLKEVEK